MGDGQSTQLWDFIAQQTGGAVETIDLSEQACAFVRSLVSVRTTVTHSDSITRLRVHPRLGDVSLLYLDSYDYSYGEPQRTNSMMNHVGELASVWERLPKGALIAVDDCHSDSEGKHVLVKTVLHAMSVEPELTGYVTVWRKP